MLKDMIGLIEITLYVTYLRCARRAVTDIDYILDGLVYMLEEMD